MVISQLFVGIFESTVLAISGKTPPSLVPYGSPSCWRASAVSVSSREYARVAGLVPSRKTVIILQRNPIACMNRKFPVELFN